jgi:hypothetical protein
VPFEAAGCSFQGAQTDRDTDRSGADATMNDSPSQGNDTVANDEVLGLQFTNGHIFYLCRSTLVTNGGDYFASHFGSTHSLSADTETRDALGRRAYFVERDCGLFEKHILPFILTKRPGTLPPFSEDRGLWRELQEEAQFYGLEEQSKLLYVTHMCSPSNMLGRGVFHYLGTNNGTSSYWNPFALGTVAVE